MAVHLWYLGVTFLVYLQYTDAGGSCQESIYLEVGKQGVVSCDFENFHIIGWIKGDGDVTKTPPFIHMERSQIYGRGYESGDYDMHPNGSLIINEVKLTNEFNYTVLFVPHLTGANEYFEVPVKVYVPPDPGYPVVNGQTNQVVIHGNTRGFLNCSLTGIRPSVHLEWVASPDEISLDSEHRATDNNDGTYNTYLTSSYKVFNSPTGIVSIKCRVAGQLADLFPSVTTVYLLLEQRFPVVNGLANQQHVVLHVNREGEVTFSMDKVSQDVSLELVTIFPDSSDEIVLDNENEITVNGDETVNITLTSKFRVLRRSIRHFTLQCRVTGQEADKYPEATTVELLVTENFPVINGLVHQQHVVLEVSREDKLTCTMNRVSQTMVLEWVFTPPVSPNEISMDNELSKTDNRDGTSNITLSSSFRVLSQSIHHVTLECRVVDENDGSQQGVTTVELLFDKTTDQEYESVLSWEPTLTIVLILFVVNMTIFWLVFIFWMKRHKDFARKYHWIVANPRKKKKDLEEAGAAEHSSRQEEEVPLQPVNNEDNIDVTSQNKEILQKCTALLSLLESLTDSGLSSGPNSSRASGDLRELEASNAQDIEADVC